MLFLCQIFFFLMSFSSFEGNANASLTDKIRARWYGPSYQPSWWKPENSPGVRSGEFSYDGPDGPKIWPAIYSTCGGLQQSPINIQTQNLKRKKTKKPLKWTNYSKTPKNLVVENSGHSIHANGIWKNSSDIPFITNGPLENRYYFSQLHFHWGKNSSRGSEHTVNKKRFPLEMHVVHDRRVDDPTNLSQEMNSDQLVVVSFMFEIVGKDNPGLAPILEGTKKVQGTSKKKTFVKPFPFDDFIETFNADYVCYKGSLTTPPCTEGVIWIIASKPIGISERQIQILRKSVKTRDGNFVENFRPIQDLNGRNVYYVNC